MSATKLGGQHHRETMIRKYGSQEAWIARMKEIGSKGGKKKFPGKGFAGMPFEKVSNAGKIGGKISRIRRKNVKAN